MSKEKKINSQEKVFTIKLILVVIAAFLAALFFRRSAGIIAMTPLTFLICGVASFISVKPSLKFVIFGLSVFFCNTVEQQDMKITITFTALCLLACIVFEIGARFIKKQKKYGYGIFASGLVLCIALSVVFVGNPISAIKAKNAILDYSDKVYPSSENAALGEFEFSSIYYRQDTKAYYIDATSTKYPTESGTLSFDGAKVSDEFKSIMESKLTQPYVLEITGLLRKYFPNDNFSVSYEDTAKFPDESLFASKDGELNGRLIYQIKLGGVQTANGMLEKVERYTEVIDQSDYNYAKIIFKSGTSQWTRRYVEVNSNRQFFEKTKIYSVPAGTSNSFNEYLIYLMENK